MNMRFITVSLCVAMLSCSGARTPDLGDFSNGSTPTNPPVGVTQETSFYVHVFDQGYFPYYLNKSGSFGTDCAISNGTTNSSIVCYLDLNEMDVYHSQYPNDAHISIQYNVPSSMCSYFNFQPAWYYNNEPGYGPSTILFQTDNNSTTGALNSFDCTVDGIAYPNCTGVPELEARSASDYNCVYDNSKDSPAGPNCCFGSYTLTTENTTDGINPTYTTSTLSWSSAGAIKNCLGGQIRNNWSHYTSWGFPTYESTYVSGTGINGKYTFVSPIAGPNQGYNIEVANYYGDVSHTHTGYVQARSTSKPYAVDPVDDRNGTDLTGLMANDAYDFRCLDKNHEVINRIRLYVRSWNTYSDFLTYGTSSGVTYAPNVTGVEGTGCSAGTTGYCDDYIKWDTQSSSHFGFDLIGPYTAPNRASYFPAEDY